MLFLDGRTNIRLHDFNKGHVTSVFTMPTNKSKNGNETLIKEIESFFFAAKVPEY